VLLSAKRYENAREDPLTINNLELDGNCLNINLSAGGCDGNSWRIDLIDSEQILYAIPPQRRLKLPFENDELCKAYITRNVAFDLKPLQLPGEEVLLRIEDMEQIILYEYKAHKRACMSL